MGRWRAGDDGGPRPRWARDGCGKGTPQPGPLRRLLRRAGCLRGAHREHDLGAAAYAIKAVQAAASHDPHAGRVERDWQRDQLPEAVRTLVLDDQVRRNAICWSVFDD